MRAVLLLLASLAACASAHAAVPAPATSSIPSHIRVVGWDGVASADTAFGSFTVTVRDLAGNPIAGSNVLVDFAAIADVRLGAHQYDPTVQLSCPHRCVRKTTGADGTARFTVVGRGTGTSRSLGVLLANVLADGVLLGRPRVEIFDLDGTGGLGANDMSLWMEDYGLLQYYGRGDYDGNGHLGANDLSIWLLAVGGGGSRNSILLACP